MPSINKILIIFIPSIIIVTFALFVRIIQYVPNSNTVYFDEEIIDLVAIFPEDPILGEKKAPISIVIFEDFACEACKTQAYLLEKLMTEHPGKIKVIWKGLPVSIYPYDTVLAHKYAFCAMKQNKFKDYYYLAFNNGNNLSELIISKIVKEIDLNEKKLNLCLNSGEFEEYLVKIRNQAILLNIQAVPTIFINNKQIKAPQSVEEWERVLKM